MEIGMATDWVPILRAAVLVGALDGISSACTSASLLGVSVNDTFSIVFCILLCSFAIVFGFVAYKAHDDRFMRVTAAIAAVLMPIAGASCIVVDEDFVKDSHPADKTPLYMFLAVAVMINFTINIIQIINLMHNWNIRDRLLTNKKQIGILIAVNVAIGMALGITFGLTEPEVHGVPKSRMTIVTFVFFFVGFLCGCVFGGLNDRATQRLENIGMKPDRNASKYDEM
jgi:uncharacterized membrane protein